LLTCEKFNAIVSLRWGEQSLGQATRVRDDFLAESLAYYRRGWTPAKLRKRHLDGLKKWVRIRPNARESYVSLIQFVIDDLFPDHSCSECVGK